MSSTHDGLAMSDAIRLAIGAAMAQAHVAFPARVERYDAAAQVVDVRPCIDRVTRTRSGALLREDLPVVASVPIAWPRSGAFGVTFPLEVGDHVLVVVCDRNIGEWRRTGDAGPARDARTHRLDGAVAVPGLYPKSAALEAGTDVTDHLVLGAFGGGPTIHVDGDEVRLGSDAATQAVALASDLAQHLSKVAIAFDALQAAVSGSPTPQPDYGVAAKAALDIAYPIAATKVKAA